MITASIVLFNQSLNDLTPVIESVLNSKIAKLYLIDNSSSKIAFLDKINDSKIEYYHNGKNVGFGAGHNIAIKMSFACDAKFHVVLNPDISFSKPVIDELEQYMYDNIDIGLMMPKILYPNEEIQYLCKMLPTPLDWFGRRFIPFKGWIERRNSIFELRDSGYDKIMNIPYLSGCFMFLRNDVLKEVGLFDEKIFMYGEDTDLSRRIHKRYRTLFFPGVSVFHLHNKESYRSLKLLIIHIKAAIYYFNKWGWFCDVERVQINNRLKRYL